MMMKRWWWWWWWSFIWFIHLIKWIYFNSWVHCSATVCMCCHLELNYVLFYYSLLFIHSGQGLTANMVTSLDGPSPLQHMWRQKHSHLNVSVLFSKLLYIYLLQHHLKWKQFISSGLQRRVKRVLVECANHASHLVWAGLPLTVWETLPKTLFGL